MVPSPPATSLPHWDLSPVYSALDSPECRSSLDQIVRDVSDLTRLFDAHAVGHSPVQLAVDETLVGAFEAVMRDYERVARALRLARTYIQCHVDTNSRDALAQALNSEMDAPSVVLAQLEVRLIAWVGAMDRADLIARSGLAADDEYWLFNQGVRAKHLMEPAEEALYAHLNTIGGDAWSRLHGNLTSQIQVSVVHEATPEPLPMSAVRALATSPDRSLRRAAYTAELAAWEQSALPLAAALNSIKGQDNAVTVRRGWPEALDQSLFDASIDRQTLDAMLGAARSAFPHFRRFWRAKARLLGLAQLSWYDLLAPVGAHGREWSYDEGCAFIVQQFATYSPRLSAFAARAFQQNWIDAEPRPGKRDGGYCTWFGGNASRIFMNYTPAFTSVSTLAHELGHAYHNDCLAERSLYQRDLPMTLAETASIFCETLIYQAALQQADVPAQIAILDGLVESAAQVVVDISSRFLFESRLFAARRQREVSVAELNQLMLDAQEQTYGDALAATERHPYMWAVKGHYYRPDYSFYNYPYMFGLLFGLGLYARYERDPERFRVDYDSLLSRTGMADVATLAAGFAIDVRSAAFWQSSLDVVRADIDRFEALAARVAGG